MARAREDSRRALLRPFDPRLVTQAKAARGLLILTVILGAAATALIIAQAGLVARALAVAAVNLRPDALAGTLGVLLAVVAARAAVTYASEAAALRAAATVKSQLRHRLTAHVLRLEPASLGRASPGEVTTLVTRGLDSLDTYFSRYLPQVVLAGLVPVAVVARIAAADWISAVLIGVTLPLIPVFAVLVGMHTRARTQRQWALLARLGGHFLDIVEGLPTLKIFGQAKRQADLIGRVTDEHRKATMSTLRQAFLSAFVLDLAATLATALVAVEVGLRLLGGHIGYQQAMLILLLTPEVYLPLRAVGTFYHASMEGAAAGGRALEILAAQPASTTSVRVTDGEPAVIPARDRPDLNRDDIVLADVTVTYPGRAEPALDQLSVRFEPGERVLITGPSGAGKSSLLAALLRFADPQSGRIEAGGVGIDALDVRWWRRQIAWLPQHPAVFTGSIRENIALGCPQLSDAAVTAAAAASGADRFIADLPQGYDTLLGERGLQLSSGQRQRLALARAFARDAQLLLLDEPTAHLDVVSAAELRDVVASRTRGKTVIVVSHNERWSAIGVRRLVMTSGRLTEAKAASGPPGTMAGDAGENAAATVTP